MLTLRNPHAVLAALATRPHDVREIRLAGAPPAGAWSEVVAQAEAAAVTIVRSSLQPAARRQTSAGGRATGAEAKVRAREPLNVEELFSTEPPANGVWLALDCLQDPHNVGAIFRTAAFFGVQGIIASRDRSAPFSDVVYDIASGGVEHVPFAQPANLRQGLEIAKQCGVWILGASEHAEKSITGVPRDRPWLLVVGNEQQGLRRLTRDTCDELCGIPSRGAVQSLNVSVATGILLSHLGSEPAAGGTREQRTVDDQ